jgi:hypothetical protein
MKYKRTYLIAITVNNKQGLPDQKTKTRSNCLSDFRPPTSQPLYQTNSISNNALFAAYKTQLFIGRCFY